MTTPADLATDYLISACDHHGTKATSDFNSAIRYVGMCLECKVDSAENPATHATWHLEEGHECWVCCAHMVIDPHGYFDN